jgi:tetratricopeptide (TPR) repeat protein
MPAWSWNHIPNSRILRIQPFFNTDMSKHNEEIQADAFVTGYAKSLYFFHHNKSLVYAVIGSVVGLIVLFGAWSVYNSGQETEAKALLVEAESAFIRKDFATALNGDGATNVGFLAIASDFSSTDSGNLAAYYAAVSASQLNDFDTALEMISNFDVPEGVMGVGAIGLHAAIYESMGDDAKAATLYEKAAGWDVNDSTTPSYLVKAANAAFNAGDMTAAATYAEDVLKRYSASQYAAEASQIKARISAAS